MNRTIKSTAAKENTKGSDNTVERGTCCGCGELGLSINATERPATPAKSTHHKKKETADYNKARKAAAGTYKSSKTQAKVLAETGKGPSRSRVTIVTGSRVITVWMRQYLQGHQCWSQSMMLWGELLPCCKC